MFAAMKSGDLDVKFIPKNDREAKVIIKNNTKQPLNVRLPDAFAGVPILAQARAGAAGGVGNNQNNVNQGVGGGMGGGMMGGGMMGGMGGGMGMFNIAPEKVAQFKVDTVCLEHGKRDPRASVPYEIRPIESFCTKPGVADLLTLLGQGKVGQRSAQVAAWHLANGMSFDQLAAKRIEHITGDSEPYFSPDELQGGIRATGVASAAAAARKQTEPSSTKSPGEQVTSDR
jgi:hypothetical protein